MSMGERESTWGDNIRRVREARGLTQAQLADAVGVRQASVSRWEAGEVTIPDAMRMAVADALNYDAVMLFPFIRERPQ